MWYDISIKGGKLWRIQNHKKKASMKYNKKNYERIYMYVFPQEKEEWQAAAKSKDISLSEFIKQCVNEKISHDKGRQ